MQAVVVVVLSVLLALVASALALITMWRVSRVSSRVSEVAKKVFDAEERQKLVDAAIKIVDFEPRLLEFEAKMNNDDGRLQQHEARLQQNAAGLETADQIARTNAAALKQTNIRVAALTREIEELQRFTSTIEQTHGRIADAFRALKAHGSATAGGSMQREAARQEPSQEHRGAA